MLTKVLAGLFSSLLMVSAAQLAGCAMNDTEDDGMESSSSGKSFEEQLKENEMKKEKQMQ